MSPPFRTISQYFDKNGDGLISAHDIQMTIQSLGEHSAISKVGDMLSELGINPAETLSYSQFEDFLFTCDQDAKLLHQSEVQGLFSRLDVDGSKYLTASELSMFMNWMQLEMRDEEMAEMVSLFDLNGDNEICFEEFEVLLGRLGYVIIGDVGLDVAKRKEGNSFRFTENCRDPEIEESKVTDIELCKLDDDLKELLSSFDVNGSGKICKKHVKEAGETFRAQFRGGATKSEDLHWDKNIERRGIGNLIKKVNHVALIVSDVGQSVQFYGEIMGFQQIRRPNFDKHGAWFTVGNVELHLIKGNPVCYQGQDLVVNHISIETSDTDGVATRLKELGVPFRQNVSVPSGADSGRKGTNESSTNDKILRQYFVRDPDGYYIEICNCSALTNYCLGSKEELIGYEEDIPELTVRTAAITIDVMNKWSNMGKTECTKRRGYLKRIQETDATTEKIAMFLGCLQAKELDEDLWKNFKERRTVWGDICQNETEESLKEILMASGNNAHLAAEIMHLRAASSGKKLVQPPAFYEQGVDLVRPPPITVPYNG